MALNVKTSAYSIPVVMVHVMDVQCYHLVNEALLKQSTLYCFHYWLYNMRDLDIWLNRLATVPTAFSKPFIT